MCGANDRTQAQQVLVSLLEILCSPRHGWSLHILLYLLHPSQVSEPSYLIQSDNDDSRYGKDYVYPTWAEALGLMMSLSSMVMVPGYAVYYVLTQPGTIMEVSYPKSTHPLPQVWFCWKTLPIIVR